MTRERRGDNVRLFTPTRHQTTAHDSAARPTAPSRLPPLHPTRESTSQGVRPGHHPSADFPCARRHSRHAGQGAKKKKNRSVDKDEGACQRPSSSRSVRADREVGSRNPYVWVADVQISSGVVALRRSRPVGLRSYVDRERIRQPLMVTQGDWSDAGSGYQTRPVSHRRGFASGRGYAVASEVAGADVVEPTATAATCPGWSPTR